MKRIAPYLLIVAAMTLVMFTSITPVFSSSSGDTIRIFVEYYQGHKNDVGTVLNAANARFHYEFDDLNSFVVTMPAAALNGIQHNPNVVGIEDDVPRYPIASTHAKASTTVLDTTEASGQKIPYGIDAVQARDVWDSDRDAIVDDGAPTGAGRTVCIIDTGYYAAHEDLVDAVGGVSQVGGDWASDGYGHGTHVAGTISAAKNTLGVVGVTPGTVDLFIVKYFDDSGAASMASDLIAAISLCADNGANVISMSLGGSRATSRERRAFDSIYAQGLLSIAAAGNDGNTAYSYPASYDSVMSVAAIDELNEVADFSQKNAQVEIAAPGVGVLSTVPFFEENTLTVGVVEYGANHIEYSANGDASGTLVDGGFCGSTGSWEGMVVLCERGDDISFYDKVINVQNSDGSAAVIYNNEPGNFFGTLGDGASSGIIGISLSQKDGQGLVTNKLGSIGDVVSIYNWPASGYQAWNGTSMATPHVSGVAALIWSDNSSWTNVEIREAMNATAIDLGDEGRDVAFGYGLVQADAALQYLRGDVPIDYPPVVVITRPAYGAEFDSGAAINFTGTAFDDLDGTLTDVLAWTSNRDGDIGTGGSISPTDLSEGEHIITASATDTGGNVGSDFIAVTVWGSGTGGVLDVLVTTDKTIYVNRDRVYVTVTVKDESTEVAGATVDWTLIFPELEAVGTVLTDASGVATFNYRINVRKTGTGASNVEAVVSKVGYQTATESDNFTVQ